MSIKGIIFDFGFTLYYFEDVSIERYFNCFKRGLQKSVALLKKSNILEDDLIKKFTNTFQKKRFDFFRKSVKTKNEFPTTYVFQNVLGMILGEEIISKLTKEFYIELADLYHSVEEKEWIPFKETRDTLKRLSEFKVIKISILSNHPHHPTIKKLLKKHDLLKYFDAVVTSGKFGKRKPAPEIFHHTLKKMGLKNEASSSVLMIGDEYADIVGGQRAGLQTILFEREYKFPFEKEIDDPNLRKINNIEEILDFI
ncbi:MAG: HAD family hydrolase [Candidatus Thorarchaeota archaeon]